MAPGGCISIGEGLEKRDKVILLIIGKTKIAAVRVDVGRDLRGRPAGNLFSRRPRIAFPQRVAGIIKMHHFLEALEVAVVHVCLDEIRSRTLVDIPQRCHPEAPVKLRRKLFPNRIVVFWTSQEISNAFVHIGRALWVGHIAERVGLCLAIESEIRVAGHTQISGRIVGEQRTWLPLRVDMTVHAFCLTVEQVVAAAFRLSPDTASDSADRRIASRALVGGLHHQYVRI